MKILIASNNKNKIAEYKELLKEFDFDVYSLNDLNIDCNPEETGKTFQENSLLKAKCAAKFTNMPVIADDSGLIVNALPELLGVYTARFLGEETPYEIKRKKLIKMLNKKSDRSAKFVCNISLVNFLNEDISFQGECEGSISYEEKGDSGFAFDPVFIPNNYNKTFSELGDEIKNKISHRKKACEMLVNYLKIHYK